MPPEMQTAMLSPSFISLYCFIACKKGAHMPLRNLVIIERSTSAFLSFLSITALFRIR